MYKGGKGNTDMPVLKTIIERENKTVYSCPIPNAIELLKMATAKRKNLLVIMKINGWMIRKQRLIKWDYTLIGPILIIQELFCVRINSHKQFISSKARLPCYHRSFWLFNNHGHDSIAIFSPPLLMFSERFHEWHVTHSISTNKNKIAPNLQRQKKNSKSL